MDRDPDCVDVPSAIRRFITRLRRDVPGISTSETLDAVRAVASCGVEDREVFRAALRTTLVKRVDDRTAFERAFASFFIAPSPARTGRRRGKGSGAPGGGEPRGRRDAPHGEPRSGDPRTPRERATPAEASRRSGERERRRPGRLRIIRPRRAADPDPQLPVRSLHDPKPRPRPHVRGRPSIARPPRPAAGPDRGAGIPTRRVELTRDLPEEFERRLVGEIPRIIREIRLRAGRRHRAHRRGRPWPARIMRRSLATGGVPFVIPARRRRPRRTEVILLVDVSWSVLRASALFLMIALEFLRSNRRVTVRLFVDRCVDGEPLLRRWDRISTRSFERVLAEAEGIDPRAPSDYGRAFWQAAFGGGGPLASRRRNAVLVILGDARNNGRDPQAWALEELASRCRRVIWIDPEREVRWRTGDSDLVQYLPHCDVVCEAHDLDGLARGIAECVASI